MRKIQLHRRAKTALLRIPLNRAEQIATALGEVAELDSVASHQNVLPLSGALRGWFRLRVGGYRAIFQPREDGSLAVLHVDWIGPRGQAYR